jgi:protein-glutamine gamma-glutamyltransferase
MRRALSLDTLSPFGQRLVWVVGGLTLTVLPHVSHLALWIVLLTGLSAALRIAIEARRLPSPPKWLRILMALVALLGVLATYRTLNGVQAGTALLVVMAGMKLLETRTLRDLTVIVFLAYFALFAAFLYNQQLLLLPYMLVTAWLLTATLMRLHQPTATMPMRAALALTGKMLLQSLPLAVLLFLFFPRLPGHFWAVPSRNDAVTGLSDVMTPGDVSELSISGEIAFRAKFTGAMPPPAERYWRGPVLHEFNGRTWSRSRASFLPQRITPMGATYAYRVTVEPHQRNWVFPLDVVTQWTGGPRANRTFDNQLLTRDPISALTSFDLQSSTQYRIEGPLPRTAQRVDTWLPKNSNLKSIAFARELRSNHGSDEDFIQAVLDKFRAEQFFYTLRPPLLDANSVDDFLFNTKRGFCEHFASAFTVLARAAGIPARVVTGYQGGEFNPMGGYLIVRQSDAHAWSEVWLDRRGWVRIDPTAAVAPERIERGLDAAIADTEPVPGRLLRNSVVLTQLRFAWDAINTFWNDQVVEFGAAHQQRLLEKLNIDDAGWEELGMALVAALAAFFVALSGYLAWRFQPQRADPVALVYQQLCRKLARSAPPRDSHEGPNDYIARMTRMRPDLAKQLEELRTLYISLRYNPAPLAQLSQFKFLVNQLNV